MSSKELTKLTLTDLWKESKSNDNQYFVSTTKIADRNLEKYKSPPLFY